MKKLLLLAVLFIGFASFAQNSAYKAGDKATDFNLENINGKKVSLAGYTNAKGFIVIFTTNHCPYAVKYEDRINALNIKYEKEGYPVIAINSDDSVDNPGDSYSNM